MNRKILLLLPALFCAAWLSAQTNPVVFDIAGKRAYRAKEPKDDSAKKFVLQLPVNDLEDFEIAINNQATLRFNCPEGNNSCIIIPPTEIADGRITLLFRDSLLIGIGAKYFAQPVKTLNGTTDTLSVSSRKYGRAATPLSIYKKADAAKKPLAIAGEPVTTSLDSLCNADFKETVFKTDTLFNFLCDSVKRKLTDCGILIPNMFENIYLPPCVDDKGNALSLKYGLLYDTRATDPLRRVFLYKIKKGKKRNGIARYEFVRLKKTLRPSVRKLLAISIIGNKDTRYIADSSFTNLFLDSAAAMQAQLNKIKPAAPAAETVTTSDSKNPPGPTDPNKAVIYLTAATDLKKDLTLLNTRYPDISFEAEKYFNDLLCIKQNMLNYLELKEIPADGKTLTNEIARRLLSYKLEKGLYKYACRVLTVLAVQYDSSLNKKSQYVTTTWVMQVPNADLLTVGLKIKDSSNYLYRHNFGISGGPKIDFSSGIFVTGLNSRDYAQVSVRFAVKDSANAPASNIRDTTGNLLRANKGKLNFSTGLLVHVYPRTGSSVNAGLVTGVTFNNSDFMWVLGGSMMFSMGNARLSLVGGLALGKQKTLDVNQQQYEWKENPSGTYYVTGDERKVPRFFTETNISTYEKRQVSWFAGITYNFAGIKF